MTPPNPLYDSASVSETAIPRTLLPQEVVTRLRAEITSGRWTPGDRITEYALSKRFGVSRTPLREALKIIAAEGLIELIPNRGAIVTEPTLEDVRDKMLVRRALEALAVELICTQASDADLARLAELYRQWGATRMASHGPGYFDMNDDFHRHLIILAQNPTLLGVYDTINTHLKLARLVALVRENLREPTENDHLAIIDALLRRDAPGARQAIEQHIDAVIDKIRAACTSQAIPA